MPDEASLHDTVVSLRQALGNCIPDRPRDVPSRQVADILYGPSSYLSTGDRKSEKFTIYLHQELEFIICGAVPPLDQYAFMACYFTTDLIWNHFRPSCYCPPLHYTFFVIESVVQQDPWIRVAWLKYVSPWGVWSALALCPPRCRHRYNKDDSASFSRKDTHS